MRLLDPDDSCLCGSGDRWGDCCGRRLPLSLRYVPVRLLGSEDHVRSGCGRGGHCCRTVHVPLTAFDILRLARRLRLSTSGFLGAYAAVTEEGAVEIDGRPECPFLVGNDCSVYDSRPDSCRMYPFWTVPAGGQEWLVERHTCSGCWHECRGDRLPLRELLERAAVAEGKKAETLYQQALLDLERAGVSDAAIEDFMAQVHDSDSEMHRRTDHEGAGADSQGDQAQREAPDPSLLRHFEQIITRLRAEYLRDE